MTFFFLPLVAGAGILSGSFAGTGAGSTGSGTGACMPGGAGVGLEGWLSRRGKK